MDYKQYLVHFVLLLLLASIIKAKAVSCPKCEYFDNLVGMCSACYIICTSPRKDCHQLCPEWPHCMRTTPEMTPTMTTPPPTTEVILGVLPSWPWIVGSIGGLVLLSIITGVAVLCSRDCRGCRAPFYHTWGRKDEVTPTVEVPLMSRGGPSAPSQDDAAAPSQGETAAPSQGCTTTNSTPTGVHPVCGAHKGPCDSKHPIAFSGNKNNCAT